MMKLVHIVIHIEVHLTLLKIYIYAMIVTEEVQ